MTRLWCLSSLLIVSLVAPAGAQQGPSQANPGLRYYYPLPKNAEPKVVEADVCVYGGTSGGVAAAVQARRMGKTAVIAEFGRHLGGLSSGGLGATDIGNKRAIGGISREFYRALGKHYGNEENWVFEPHVAEKVFNDFVRGAGVPVYYENRLAEVKKEGPRIRELVTENGNVFRAKVFIDATYEGDLLAFAGVTYHVGREANATYGETLNGVHFGHPNHNFNAPVDPYVTPGDPSSGLLPLISAEDPGKQGEGDHRVQAYNFRMCLTNAPDRLPFPKPAGYDPARYELLRRYVAARNGLYDALRLTTMMTKEKTDTNNFGGFSTDHIGFNYAWPDGVVMKGGDGVRRGGQPKEVSPRQLYEAREKIFQDHVSYQQGLMYMLVNDPGLPESVRKDAARWGLPKDEFVETGHWPHQLYVREARRMVSGYVMSEKNCRKKEVVEDSVGLAAYNMDSHNCQRVVVDGKVKNEGNVEVPPTAPYPIAYRAIVPREEECANLLVPVCLSSSHIAYGSIRMEPVFMVLGQSAATAAAMAIDAGVPVQKVEYARLKERLLADAQILEWTGPANTAAARPMIDPAKLPGVVVDDANATLKGLWSHGTALSPFVGAGYHHDANDHKGELAATFTARLPKAGRYEVRLAYTPNPNRATNVPVTVRSAGGEKTVTINQRSRAPIDGLWVSLGAFDFTTDQPATVTITNANTDGHVILDAVHFVPAD